MELPPEVIMLACFTVSLLMIMLGTAINGRRIHKKLDRILSIIISASTNINNSIQIRNNKNNRQDIFPTGCQDAKPDKIPQDNPNKDDCNNTDPRVSSHRGAV